MNNDFSDIPSTGCNYATSPTTIINRTGATNKTYTLIGNKFVLTRITNSNYSDDTYQCINVNNLEWSHSELLPLYEFLALVCVICVWAFVYFVIFRTGLKRKL